MVRQRKGPSSSTDSSSCSSTSSTSSKRPLIQVIRKSSSSSSKSRNDCSGDSWIPQFLWMGFGIGSHSRRGLFGASRILRFSNQHSPQRSSSHPSQFHGYFSILGLLSTRRLFRNENVVPQRRRHGSHVDGSRIVGNQQRRTSTLVRTRR